MSKTKLPKPKEKQPFWMRFLDEFSGGKEIREVKEHAAAGQGRKSAQRVFVEKTFGTDKDERLGREIDIIQCYEYFESIKVFDEVQDTEKTTHTIYPKLHEKDGRYILTLPKKNHPEQAKVLAAKKVYEFLQDKEGLKDALTEEPENNIIVFSEAPDSSPASLDLKDKRAIDELGLAFVHTDKILGKRTQYPGIERAKGHGGYMKLKYKSHQSSKNTTLSAIFDTLKGRDENQKGGLFSELLGDKGDGKRKPEEYYTAAKQVHPNGDFTYWVYNQKYIGGVFKPGGTMVSENEKYRKILDEAKAKHGKEEFLMMGVSRDINDYPKFVDTTEPLEPKPFTQDFLHYKHLTIAGMNGSGKTVTAVGIICSIKISHPNSIFYFIDAKGSTDWDALCEYTSPNPLAKKGNDDFKIQMVANINAVYDHLEKRRKLFSRPDVMAANISVYREKTGIDLPRVYLNFEEISAVIGEEFLDFDTNYQTPGTAASKLYQILIQGRSFGCHVFFISQRLVDTAIPLKLSAQTTKIVHKVEANDALSTHINAPEATSLPIGMFIVRDDNDARRVGSAPFIGNDIDSSVRQLFALAGITPCAKAEQNPYTLDSFVAEEKKLPDNLPHFLKLYLSAVFRHVFPEGLKPSVPPASFSNATIQARNPIYRLSKEDIAASLVVLGKGEKQSASDWMEVFERCEDSVLILSPVSQSPDEALMKAALESKKEVFIFSGIPASGLAMRAQAEQLYENETPRFIWEKMVSESNLITRGGKMQSPEVNQNINDKLLKELAKLGVAVIDSSASPLRNLRRLPVAGVGENNLTIGRLPASGASDKNLPIAAPASEPVPSIPEAVQEEVAPKVPSERPAAPEEVTEVTEAPATEAPEKVIEKIAYEKGLCAFCGRDGVRTKIAGKHGFTCAIHTNERRNFKNLLSKEGIDDSTLTDQELWDLVAAKSKPSRRQKSKP